MIPSRFVGQRLANPKSITVLFIDTVFAAVLAEDTSRSIWPDSMSDGWGSGVDDATNLRTSGPLAVRPAHKAPGKDREVHPYYFGATSCDCTSESLYEDPACKLPSVLHSSQDGSDIVADRGC